MRSICLPGSAGRDRPNGEAATKWELFVFEYARSRNQPVASLVHGAFADGVMDVPFSFVLAKSGECRAGRLWLHERGRRPGTAAPRIAANLTGLHGMIVI